MTLLLEMRVVRAQQPSGIVLLYVSRRELKRHPELPTSCCWVDGGDLAQGACNSNGADDRDETVHVRLDPMIWSLCEVAYRLKNRQGAPPVVNAVAMTVDSASHVAIKQRHRLPSDHIE